MKSSFLEKSKRSLALLLTAGMVFTSLPMDVFAAPADEIIEEEAVVAEDATDAVANDAAVVEEEVTEAGSDSIEPDFAYQDLTLVIKNATTGATQVKVLDPDGLNEGGGVDYTFANLDAYSFPGSAYTKTLKIDSANTNGFSFVVAPDTTNGQQIKSVPLKVGLAGSPVSGSYYFNFTGSEYKTSAWDPVVTTPGSEKFVGVEKVDSLSGLGYTVTDYPYADNFKVITLTPSLLSDVLTKFHDKNGEWAPSAAVTASDAKKAALATRPVLYVEIDASEAGSFTFEQPTAIGVTLQSGDSSALTDIVSDNRKIAVAATTDGAAASTGINVSLLGKYKTSYDFADAKVTMTITKKDTGENVDTLDTFTDTASNLETNPENIVVFPYTIGADENSTSSSTTGIGSAVGVSKNLVKGNNAGSWVANELPFALMTTATGATLYVSQYIVNAAYSNDYRVGFEFDFTTVEDTKYPVTVAGLATADDLTTHPYVETIKGANATTSLDTEVVKDDTVQITVVGRKDDKGGERNITDIDYTVDGKDYALVDKGALVDGVAGTKTNAYTFTGVTTGKITGPVTFSIKTSEYVELTTATAENFNLYKADDGSAITTGSRAATGEALSFTVDAKNKKKVSKVEYTIGIGGDAVTGTAAYADGVYTIPNVNNYLSIDISTATGDNYLITRTGSDDTPSYVGGVVAANDGIIASTHGTSVTIVNSKTQTITWGTGSDSNQWAKQIIGVHGEPFYFTVTPPTGKMIKTVTYKMGTSTTPVDAIYVSGTRYAGSATIYKTAPVTGDVEINVTYTNYVFAYQDGLSKAKVTTTLADGTVATVGTSTSKIAIDAKEPFKFTITGSADNIAVKKVNWTVNSVAANASDLEPNGAVASYTVAKNMAGDVVIKAVTEETVDPATYSVEFKSNGETGKKSTDKLQNTYDEKRNLTAQALTIRVNETADLGTTPATISLKAGGTVTGATLGYKVSKTKDNVKVVQNAGGGATIANGQGIKGYAVGEDTITLTAKKADGSGTTNNSKVYTADLPVTVVEQFKSLEIVSSSDVIDDSTSTYADMYIKAVNGRTGKDEVVAAEATSSKDGVGKVVWSFDPDVSNKVTKHYGLDGTVATSVLTAVDGGTDVDSDGIVDDSFAEVVANSTATSPITVVAKIYNDATTPALIATLTKEVSIIKAADYVFIPTLTISNGQTVPVGAYVKNKSSLSATNGNDVLAIETLEASKGGHSEASLSYKVYKQLKATVTTTLTPASTAANVTKALADGDYEEVTSGITYKGMTYKFSDVSGTIAGAGPEKDDKGYIELAGEKDTDGYIVPSNGVFTVTGKKFTPYTDADNWTASLLAVQISVDGIVRETETIGMHVVDNAGRQDVMFLTNGVKYAANGQYVSAADSTATVTNPANGEKVIRVLNDTYLNNFEKSTIEAFADLDANNNPTTQGVVVTKVSEGTKITLPTAADFTTATQSADPRAVLAGWVAKKVTSGTTVATANTSEVVVCLASDPTTPLLGFAPGAEVLVYKGTDPLAFEAVWAPKYAIDSTVSGGIAYAGVTITDDAANTGAAISSSSYAALGALVNADVAANTNKYVSPVDTAKADGYNSANASDYKDNKKTLYSGTLSKLAAETSMNTTLFAPTLYGIDGASGTPKYALQNISAGYSIDYVAGTSDSAKGNLTIDNTTRKITGRAEGTSGSLLATLTEGTTTWEFPGGTVTVLGGSVLNAAFINDDTKTKAATAGYYAWDDDVKSITLEKSQLYKDVELGLLIDKASASLPTTSSGGDYDDMLDYTYTFESSNESAVSVKAVDASSNKFVARISPNGIVTTAPVTITATIYNKKNESTTATLSVSVVEDKVDILISDAAEKDSTKWAYADDVVTGLGGASDGIKFAAAAYLKTDTAVGSELTGSWSALTPAASNKVAEAAAPGNAPATDGSDREVFTFSSVGEDIDVDNVTIYFTYGTGSDAVTYTKDVAVKTHYNLVLAGGVASDTGAETFITVNGARQLDAAAMKAASHDRDLAAATVTIPITIEENRKTQSNGSYTYEVDLSKYNIEQIDTVANGNKLKATTADFWFFDGKGKDTAFDGTDADENDFTNLIAYINDKVGITNTYDISFSGGKITGLTAKIMSDAESTKYVKAGGVFTVYPEIIAAKITKATPNVTTVTLENASGKEYKDIEVTVLPVNTSDAIRVIPEDQGFFRIKDNEASAATSWLTGAGAYDWTGAITATDFGTPSNGDIFAVTTGTDTRTDKFALGMVTVGGHPKAGSTTLHLYDAEEAAADITKASELATITLNVNGLNYVDATTTNYIENGVVVKNAKRTVGTKTYVFDDEGKQVTGSKVVDLADGSKVLVLDGELAKAGVRPLGTDSYIVDANGAILSGWQTAEDGRKYYADPENGNKLADGIQEISGKKYYFVSYVLQTASASANEYEQTSDKKYYVNKDGEVAISKLFKVDGKQYLANETGAIVTRAAATLNPTSGNYEYTQDNVVYFIADDDTAVVGKEYFMKTEPTFTWTWDAIAAKPTVSVAFTYTADDGDAITETKAATVDDGVATVSTLKKFTATVKPTYATAKGAEIAEISKTKIFDTVTGTEKLYYNSGKKPVWKWTWNKEAKTASATATFVLVDASDTKVTIEDTVAATVSAPTIKGDKYTFDASVNYEYFATATATETTTEKFTDTQIYVVDAEGNAEEKSGAAESGSSIGEPEQTGAAAVNLFYTDAELSIPLPTEADVTKGTGAWTSFFKVESDGTVTVIPTATADRKKAASAKNSLIVIPTVDSEGNVIGEFEYSLPVFYQKPALKLTSTKGNVKTGAGDQVLVTKVLEKKSTGEFEPLDVSDQDTDKVALFAAKTGTVAAEAGDNPGDVKLTASAKASGKVVVQLPNWSDKVELNYTVGASAKGVVTASVKSLTFNTAADKDAAQAQTFNVFLNGNEIASEDDGVTVELPKKDPGLTITGISEGKVTGSEIGFEYGSAAPTKGNYTYKFKSSDGGVATVKIVVSDAALANKALTYKIPSNGKMNIINKTPMVLVPQFKGVSGEITDVTTDNTSFEVEYNEESGQVIVAPADWSKISATNQSVILKTTVSGVECTTEVKFKPLAKKPTVKIDKLVLPKDKVVASTDDDAAIGFAYINSVVKTGGKSFSVAPDKVEFLDGKNVLAKDDTNWTPVTKSGVTCFYDTEAGFIVVKALPGTNGKLKAVKVQLTYGTTTVTKSLAIKVK